MLQCSVRFTLFVSVNCHEFNTGTAYCVKKIFIVTVYIFRPRLFDILSL